VLAGGSAFGLDAASGVVRYLEERGVGFDVLVTRVPIVPAAILFDLGIGRADVRPDAEMGYQACLAASSYRPKEGNIGAGTGATVGKILGLGQAMKSGIGTASVEIGAGVIVAAIAAVNSFGDIIEPTSGSIIAGARSILEEPITIDSQDYFADTLEVMRSIVGRTTLGFTSRENTVIGVVATNARMDKEQINKVAQMAQDGVARTVRPAHTMLDGDTIFAIATGELNADVNIVSAFGAQVFAQAILRAVRSAKSVAGLPAASRGSA
jgi:L-aminopeptidase/D-esterase-like protein